MNGKKSRDNAAEIRQRADALARERSDLNVEKLESFSADETHQLLHELRVHQIELEMQNEELRLAQENLEASRARYFDFYDLSPMGYLTVSEKGLLLEANLTATKMLDMPRQVLLKKPISQFILPEDQNLYYFHRKALFEKDKAAVFDLRLARPGKPPLWAQISMTPVQEGGETVSRIIISDISGRKLAEEALIKSRERLKTIIDSIDALVYIADIETHDLLLVNEYGSKMLGDVSGRKCWEVLQGRKEPCPFCTNDILLTPEGYPVGVHRWVFQNTVNKRWYDLRDRAIQWIDGRWVRLEIATDISELKDAEEKRLELERKLQQVHKTESLSRMAEGIAHHMNNLLGAAIGNLELAMEHPSTFLDTRVKLASAMTAASRAAEVGGLLLGYLGHTIVRRQPIDLSESCRQYLLNLFTGLPENILMEPAFPVHGPVISADISLIKGIISNLVANAREAIGDRPGKISVSLSSVTLKDISEVQRFPAEFSPGALEYACLEVKDTGCGIAETDFGNLFDPFYSTKFAGRGLGLAVILGAVKTLEGCITVESKLDLGSVFRVFLPLSEEPVRPLMQERADPVATFRTGMVLLVEDEAMVREMAVAMLSHLGMTVLKAADGVEALELFKDHQNEVVCVLCDLMMPRMDGWATIEALRSLAPNLPIILASGFSEGRVMENNCPERPQVFLAKPYGLATLKAALTKAMLDKHSSS